MTHQDTIAILGGGAWGTALAVHAAGLGHPVRLWAHEADVVERVNRDRDNPDFLPGVALPSGIVAFSDPAECVGGAALVVGVVPSAFARDVYRRLTGAIDPGVPLMVATKGIEEASLALPLTVCAEELGAERPLAVLSGPSFAAELARGKPTAAVIAAGEAKLARTCQEALSSPALRLYASADPVGVQLAGALKNVIAIAAGVADSLGMGANAQAALITRGLAEMTRLGVALGAEAETFSGLAGLGDLVLTCTGGLSRNRGLGQRVGRGESLDAILASTRTVAEGVRTTRCARALGLKAGVELPIVEELHRLLFEGGSPREALGRLFGRPLTTEIPKDPRRE